MSLSRNPAILLESLGEEYTIRRVTRAAGANTWTAGAETVTYHAQRGTRRKDLPNTTIGLVRDAQSVVTLSPDYEAPRQGDRVAAGTIVSDTGIEWLEVVHVDPVRIEGRLSKFYAFVRD